MTHHHSPLTAEDFHALLDCHGADLSRWPVDSVKPALALMQADDGARAAFERDVALDNALRHGDAACGRRLAARHGATAPALQARIMAAIGDAAPVMPAAAIAQVARQSGGFLGLRTLFAPGGGLLMIGLVGFMIGFMQPASAQDTVLDGLVHGQDIVIAGENAAAMGEW